MRTTIDVNNALLMAGKARAENEHRILKETFGQTLRAYLAGPSRARTEAPPIPAYRGSGVQPGVDLTVNATLRAIMAAES